MSSFRKIELTEEGSSEPSKSVTMDINEDKIVEEEPRINENIIKIIEDIVEKYLAKRQKKTIKPKVKVVKSKTIRQNGGNWIY